MIFFKRFEYGYIDGIWYGVVIKLNKSIFLKREVGFLKGKYIKIIGFCMIFV